MKIDRSKLLIWELLIFLLVNSLFVFQRGFRTPPQIEYWIIQTRKFSEIFILVLKYIS